MKQGIHPTYHPDAKVSCSGCNREFTVGSTATELRVELCSQCHPFYTGKQKLVDTAGRVERFQARAAKAKAKGKQPPAGAKAKSPDQVNPPGSKEDAKDSNEPTPADRLAAMKRDLERRQD